MSFVLMNIVYRERYSTGVHEAGKRAFPSYTKGVGTMRKRGIPILIRLNAEEKQNLAKQVKKSGLSQEGYLRSLINGYVPTELPPPTIFP
ncbi:hypothetical protein [Pelotomaculum sp. FP]|uniref:plasmid mobilization protein n=1 Tax=Pelotomaculum sp. FP TaxID=261474 RepID=UPI0032B80EF0